MAETKKEFEDTRDATDTGDLFLGGRVETKNVNATEDKSKFVHYLHLINGYYSCSR